MRSCWKDVASRTERESPIGPLPRSCGLRPGSTTRRSVADAREQLAALAREQPRSRHRSSWRWDWAEGTASPETIAWATRRVLERLSEERRVVVVLDDLHWAEDALLDLVEHVAGHSRGRILLVGLARPELLESRPEWPRTIVRLAPLATSEVDSLAAALGVARGGARAGARRRGRQPPLRRGAGCNARGRPWRRGPRDARGAPRGEARPARTTGARGRGARLGRGAGLPPGRGGGALRGEGTVRAAIERLMERDLCVAARSGLCRRRRLPVQTHPDPRRRLPRNRETLARRAPRAFRGLALPAEQRIGSPRSRRSSATTSSRRAACLPSSARSSAPT